MIEKDTIVIGAGLTGLSTAFFLNKKAKDFLVLEKRDKVGGVINTVSENGFLFETGPNTGVFANSDVADLFEGLEGYCKIEKANSSAKKRYVLKKGKWYAMPMGLFSAIATPLFSIKDKFRILGEPFRPPGTNPHETLSELVRRRMGKSFLDYAIDPFIKGVYAGDPDKLIPKYALPKLYNLEQTYGSFIGGSIKKKKKEKGTKDLRVDRSVFSSENGLSSLCNAVQDSIGKDKFIMNADGVTVDLYEDNYLVSWKNNNGEIQKVKTKNVISTIGSYALKELLHFIEDEHKKHLDNLKYAKVIVISLGFNKWEGIPLDGFGGLIPSKEKRDILGVLYMSSLFKNRAPEEGALLSVFMGGIQRPEMYDLSDNELIEILKKEMKSLMKINDFKPNLLKISRYKYAIPQYEVNSKERFGMISIIEEKFNGIYIGGNLIGGIGMADRIQQGKILADRI